MSVKEFTYIHKGKEYRLVVTRKRMKSVRYTYKDGVFKVSAPIFFVTQKQIEEGLDKYADKLLALDVRTKASDDSYIYILGKQVPLQESGEIKFNDDTSIVYKNREDLNKKLLKWFLVLVEKRHRYYENIMGIKKPYKVRIRKVRTRYGSNSYQTHSITYSSILMHYTVDVIDSVIVHELAHDSVRDHSDKFYSVVYKYCPNYKALHKRLRKGEFA